MMRLFYLKFQKIQTLSGQLSWSHYLEILKVDEPLEAKLLQRELEKALNDEDKI